MEALSFLRESLNNVGRRSAGLFRRNHMKISNIINLVLVVFFVLAAMTGLKRGILSKGRWALGIVFGLLAVPLVSPVIESLLKKTPLVQMITTDIPIIAGLSTYLLRMLVFSISLVIVKNIVYHLTDFDLPKGVKIIDQTAGSLFSVFEACLVIWLFEWLVAKSPVDLFSDIHASLMSSPIYALLAKNNFLTVIFTIK